MSCDFKDNLFDTTFLSDLKIENSELLPKKTALKGTSARFKKRLGFF